MLNDRCPIVTGATPDMLYITFMLNDRRTIVAGATPYMLYIKMMINLILFINYN